MNKAKRTHDKCHDAWVNSSQDTVFIHLANVPLSDKIKYMIVKEQRTNFSLVFAWDTVLYIKKRIVSF